MHSLQFSCGQKEAQELLMWHQKQSSVWPTDLIGYKSAVQAVSTKLYIPMKRWLAAKYNGVE